MTGAFATNIGPMFEPLSNPPKNVLCIDPSKNSLNFQCVLSTTGHLKRDSSIYYSKY